MPAPSPGTRTTPTGSKLLDGFKTVVGFSSDPSICLWEKSVKPNGVDIGEMIDVTDMWNTEWRTAAFRALAKVTAGEHKCSYDPDAYNKILTHVLGINQTVTVHFPDGSTLAFFGGVKSFVPDALEEGKQPEATVMFEATNLDPSSGGEYGPVMTAHAGT